MNKDSGIPLTSLQVDGGMTQNSLLMQLQADLVGIPVGQNLLHNLQFFVFISPFPSYHLCVLLCSYTVYVCSYTVYVVILYIYVCSYTVYTQFGRLCRRPQHWALPWLPDTV